MSSVNAANRRQRGDESRFHVARAPTVYFVACDSSAERVCSRPGEQVTGWDDVDVRIKHERRPVPATRNAADYSPCLRTIDLDTREVSLCERLVEWDLPGVDGEGPC